jgi:LysR family malonate utilization transcriptional regulator
VTIWQPELRDRIDEEITFRKLEVLLAYTETENLAKMAEALDVSTVSVHRASHSLEQGVRCALFRHEGRNRKPTDAARTLAEVAREVMVLMSEGVRSTREAASHQQSDYRHFGSVTKRRVPLSLAVLASKISYTRSRVAVGQSIRERR